jgi:hypothetical protein
MLDALRHTLYKAHNTAMRLWSSLVSSDRDDDDVTRQSAVDLSALVKDSNGEELARGAFPAVGHGVPARRQEQGRRVRTILYHFALT